MKQFAKKAIAEAERLGYVYDRTNSKNFEMYVHPVAGEVGISPTMDERGYRNAVRQMQKSLGVVARNRGRDAVAARERGVRRSDLDAIRLAAQRRDVEEQHAEFLARTTGADLKSADRDTLRQIEARMAEISALERLMTETPASADHRGTGQARHRSGTR